MVRIPFSLTFTSSEEICLLSVISDVGITRCGHIERGTSTLLDKLKAFKRPKICFRMLGGNHKKAHSHLSTRPVECKPFLETSMRISCSPNLSINSFDSTQILKLKSFATLPAPFFVQDFRLQTFSIALTLTYDLHDKTPNTIP